LALSILDNRRRRGGSGGGRISGGRERVSALRTLTNRRRGGTSGGGLKYLRSLRIRGVEVRFNVL